MDTTKKSPSLMAVGQDEKEAARQAYMDAWRAAQQNPSPENQQAVRECYQNYLDVTSLYEQAERALDNFSVARARQGA